MRFSIVMPTRNRADTLRHAIRSAVTQDFDDYEIVVSNNGSTDETEAVVREFDNPKIRYLITPESFSMPDHWEWALGRVSGDWVLFLCDDDALTPDCLSRLHRSISAHPDVQAVQYESIVYVYNDGIDASGNYLRARFPPLEWTETRDSRRQLGEAFRTLSGKMPKFLNSAVASTLVDEIRKRYGRVFHRWAPDYSAGILILSTTDKHVLVHQPLLVWGRNMKSYGSGARHDPEHLRRFLREFREFTGSLELTPYPELLTVTNMVYDTQARAGELVAGSGIKLEMDGLRYRQMILEEIDIYLGNGHDDYGPERERVWRDLRRSFPSYRLWHRKLKERLRKRLRKTRTKVMGKHQRTRIIRGDSPERPFSNIAEAASFTRRHLRVESRS